MKIDNMGSAITNKLSDGTVHTIHPNGLQTYHLDRKYHRVDGPAIIGPDGSQYWYFEDNIHRTDGPAVIHPNGDVSWYFKGVKYHVSSTEEFMAVILIEEVHDLI